MIIKNYAQLATQLKPEHILTGWQVGMMMNYIGR
jgi:hypothetical protein